MNGQLTIFDFLQPNTEQMVIDKKIRLIELFAG